MDIPKAIRTAREWDRSQRDGNSPPSDSQFGGWNQCGCPECVRCAQYWKDGGPKGAPLYVFRTERIIRTEEHREQLIGQIRGEQDWCRDHVRAHEDSKQKITEGGVHYTKQDTHDLANLLEVIEMVEVGEKF